MVWSKGGLELQADERREPRQQGCMVELMLRDLRWEDAGEYTCTCGSQATSATVTVTGGPQGGLCPLHRPCMLWGALWAAVCTGVQSEGTLPQAGLVGRPDQMFD